MTPLICIYRMKCKKRERKIHLCASALCQYVTNSDFASFIRILNYNPDKVQKIKKTSRTPPKMSKDLGRFFDIFTTSFGLLCCLRILSHDYFQKFLYSYIILNNKFWSIFCFSTSNACRAFHSKREYAFQKVLSPFNFYKLRLECSDVEK